MTRIAMALWLALAASAATAGPIYRCGPDGRTYSQTPCTGGTVVESTDPRSAAQRAEARRVEAAERKAAAERERERKAAEQASAETPAASPEAAASAAEAPAADPASRRQVTASGNFLAIAPTRAASAAK